MTQVPRPLPPVAVINGVVMQEVPCRRCAYNLRGLASNGICPECAAPVEISINGDLLRYSDPNYLELLRRGIHLIFAGVIATIVIIIVTAVMGTRSASNHALDSILATVGSILIAWGSWRLTSPDPSSIGESRYGTIRQTIRICLIIGIGDDLIKAALATRMLPAAAFPGLTVVQFLAAAIGLVGFCAQLEYLARLARRFPNDQMSTRARSLLKGFAISEGILYIGSIPTLLLGQTMGPAIVAFGCIALVLLIVLLVLFVRYLVLLGNFATQFREAAEQARVLWADAETRSRPQAP